MCEARGSRAILSMLALSQTETGGTSGGVGGVAGFVSGLGEGVGGMQPSRNPVGMESTGPALPSGILWLWSGLCGRGRRNGGPHGLMHVYVQQNKSQSNGSRESGLQEHKAWRNESRLVGGVVEVVGVCQQEGGGGRTADEGAGDDACDAVLKGVRVLVEDDIREVGVGGGQRQRAAGVGSAHLVEAAVLRRPRQRPTERRAHKVGRPRDDRRIVRHCMPRTHVRRLWLELASTHGAGGGWGWWTWCAALTRAGACVRSCWSNRKQLEATVPTHSALRHACCSLVVASGMKSVLAGLQLGSATQHMDVAPVVTDDRLDASPLLLVEQVRKAPRCLSEAGLARTPARMQQQQTGLLPPRPGGGVHRQVGACGGGAGGCAPTPKPPTMDMPPTPRQRLLIEPKASMSPFWKSRPARRWHTVMRWFIVGGPALSG